MSRKRADPELVILDQFTTMPIERAELLLKVCTKIVGDRRPQITAPSTANPITRPGRPRKTALDAPEG